MSNPRKVNMNVESFVSTVNSSDKKTSITQSCESDLKNKRPLQDVQNQERPKGLNALAGLDVDFSFLFQ